MRAERDKFPVSLFSFQDIVTSITGIMFLVAVLLALALCESRFTAANTPKSDQDEIISRKENELRELRKKAAATVPAGQRPELIRQVNLLRRETAALPAPDPAAEARHNAKLRELWEQIERQTAANAQSQTHFEQLSQELAAEKQRMRFEVDPSEKRHPVFLDCRQDRIEVLNGGETQTLEFDPERLDELIRRATSGHRPQLEYFVVLARPSSFGYAEELLTRLLIAGFDRGCEVLPEQTAALFDGTTEAAQ
ncbi:MAG: hypothetical protein PHI35_06425 [Victivallaceae bacterium]|nr:hypothetical protein [Victivallaceae bacterium]